MATWHELSLENMQAAKTLLREKRYRPAVNRAYYAAYCAVTSELVTRKVAFAHGWNNPAHEQLPALIVNNLPLSREEKRRLKRRIRTLRQFREDADYRPGITIDGVIARDCLRDAATVLKDMGVTDEPAE